MSNGSETIEFKKSTTEVKGTVVFIDKEVRSGAHSRFTLQNRIRNTFPKKY